MAPTLQTDGVLPCSSPAQSRPVQGFEALSPGVEYILLKWHSCIGRAGFGRFMEGSYHGATVAVKGTFLGRGKSLHKNIDTQVK